MKIKLDNVFEEMFCIKDMGKVDLKELVKALRKHKDKKITIKK